jgi:hypothetical protein
MSQYPPPHYGYQPYTHVYHSPQGVYTWTPNPQQSYLLSPPHPQYSPYHSPSSPASPPSLFSPAWTPAPFLPQLPAHTSAIQIAPWLIPNPLNPNLPHTLWDLTQPPVLVKRLTGKHVVVDMKSEFNEDATYPAVPKAHIRLAGVDLVHQIWGPIVIRSEGNKPLSVGDVINGVYAFFQKPVLQRDMDKIKEHDEKNYDTMLEAMEKRCYSEPGLPGRAWKEGMKRVDALGAYISFGGLTVVENEDDTWEFSLLVLNRSGQ